MGMTLRADRDELRRFVACLFPYADSDTFAALRGFDQFRRDVPPPVMGSVRINGDLNALVEQAWRAAQRCANATAPIVFAPPICTFTVAKSARGGDLADGLVLSVELDDGATLAACAKLERLLGPCTVVVASGGDAVDPLTGELSPKLHLHWRLSEPTRDAAEHAKLRLARDLACRLAGGDPTGKSVVHPLRWPGSWNCKAEPRMARITAENPQAEIHLDEALERLTEAVEAAGLERVGVPRSGDPQSSPALVASAMAAIPNAGTEVHYDTWIRLGYGCFRASGGVGWGRDAWEAWSKKSDKYDAGEQDAAWRRIGAAVSAAPAKVTIGAGTIFFMAAAAGWTRPRPQPTAPEPPPYDGCSDMPEEEEPHPVPPHPKIEPAIRLFFGEEAAQAPSVSDTVVRGIAHKGSITLIYGMPKTGKSFLATDLALAVADPTRETWMGHRIKLHGPTLVVACEGHGGYWKRLQATGRLVPPQFVLGCGRTTLIRDPDLAGRQFVPHPDDVEAAITAIRERLGAPPVMVLIDTVFRSFGTGNVSESAHMKAYVDAATNCAQQGIAMVLVHHSTKTGITPNGSVVLMGSSDTIILTERVQDKDTGDITRSWHVEFAKDDAEDHPRQFHLQVIDGIIDAEGETVSSCRLVDLSADNSQESKPTNKKRGALGAHAQTLWQIIQDLFAEQSSDALPHQTTVSVAAIRGSLRANGIDYPPSKLRDRLTELVSKGYLKTNGDQGQNFTVVV